MKDEEAIDRRERFPTFRWTRKTSLKRGDRRLSKESGILCVFFGEGEGGGECVCEKFLILMCGKMLFMGKMCANKNHEGKLCVVSSCNRVHGRISIMKPLGS